MSTDTGDNDNSNNSDNPPAASNGSAGETADDGKGAAQRDALLQSERNANRNQPRNFKDDALTDKVVHVDPDGTGPSPIDTLDPPKS